MAQLDFVLMCGRLASHHDTALAHAMLHAVAVWVDKHPGGYGNTPRASTSEADVLRG